MKRLLPSTLLTFIQSTPNLVKADCFVITLPTGQLLCVTEGQWDITFLGAGGTPGWTGAQTTFSAAKYGRWSRGRIVSEAGTQCASNTMTLSCVPQPTTQYPGLPIGILSGALNHLFDAATVAVYTAYFALGAYGVTSHGVEPKWYGTVTKIPKLNRPLVQFECADPLFLLNLKVPARLMQSNCPWGFCDTNCGLSAANYTVDFTASTTSQSVMTPTMAFTQPAGYFAQGVVKCLAGHNAGLSQTVKIHASGVLTMMVPWLLPVVIGDTFSVIKGCDKTPGTCATTNQANGTPEPNNFQTRFGGTPYAPVPSTAV